MEFTNVIKERFSTRKFSDKKVEKEKLARILEAARLAPTAKNMQAFKIYVIESEEGLASVDKATKCRYHAKTVLIICGDKNGYSHGNHSFVDIDTSIVTTHLMLAATNEGVDNIWIGLFEPEILRTEFNIPDNLIPVNVLPLGYKTTDFEPSPLHFTRKNIEDLVEYK